VSPMNTFADIVLAPIAMFSGKPLAVGIALFLLLTALGLYVFWLYPMARRFVGTYKGLTLTVRKIRQSQGTQEEHLGAVDAVFEKSRLKSNWHQYRACVEFDEGQVYSYSDPQPFFGADRVPGHSYVKWSATLSGVFLTIGLAFTFVGLSAALLQMGGDGHSLDPKQLRQAVEGILAVSSVKFITSIAGILAYIFWTIVARIQANRQEYAVQALNAELRLLSNYVAPEMVLRQQLLSTHRQEQLFQTFGNDLAVAIGQQIEAALRSREDALPTAIAESVGVAVAQAIAPISTELSEIGVQIGKAGGEITGGAGDIFSKAWKEGVGGHLELFGEQMSKTISALESLPEKVRATEAGFGGEIDRTTRQLAETTMSLTGSLDRTQAMMAATVAAFSDKISSIPSVIESASRESATAIGSAIEKTLADSSRTAAEASRVGADQLAIRVGEIAGALTESSNRLREAGDHSAAGLKAARDELKMGVKDGIKTIADTAENASVQLSKTVSGLADVVNGLTACLSRTATQIEAQQGRLATAGEVVGAASTKLATAAGNVETATTPLSGSIRNINVALDQLSKATEQLHRSSASGQKVAELLNGSLEKAKSVSETQARQFTDLEKAVKQTLNELNNGVLRLGKEISECIETYDSEIAKSIGSLETAILDVADIVDQRRPGALNPVSRG
jgi:hypothetical protein